MITSKVIPIYFALIGIYFAQGALYPTGSILSQASLILVILFGLLYILKTWQQKKKQTFVKLWMSLLGLILFSFILTGEISNPLHFSQLKNILFFFLALYPAYYWSRYKNLNEKNLFYLFLMVFPLFILAYFDWENYLKSEYSKDSVVNNTAYYFVSLIPFLYLIRNKWLAFGSLFIIAQFLILGAKRGALIIGGLGIILYLFYYLKYLSTKSIKNKIKNLVLFSVIIGVASFFLTDIIEQNSYIVERFEDARSKRPENYLALIDNWYNANSFKSLILGFGFFTTPLFTPEGVMAHNDWLEMLTNFGLIGVILYSVLLIKFFSKFRSYRQPHLRFMHLTIAITWLLISLFSMWFNNFGNIFYAILIGYLLGQFHIEKYNTDINYYNKVNE